MLSHENYTEVHINEAYRFCIRPSGHAEHRCAIHTEYSLTKYMVYHRRFTSTVT